MRSSLVATSGFSEVAESLLPGRAGRALEVSRSVAVAPKEVKARLGAAFGDVPGDAMTRTLEDHLKATTAAQGSVIKPTLSKSKSIGEQIEDLRCECGLKSFFEETKKEEKFRCLCRLRKL